jgi:hypothetical protein
MPVMGIKDVPGFIISAPVILVTYHLHNTHVGLDAPITMKDVPVIF